MVGKLGIHLLCFHLPLWNNQRPMESVLALNRGALGKDEAWTNCNYSSHRAQCIYPWIFLLRQWAGTSPLNYQMPTKVSL